MKNRSLRTIVVLTVAVVAVLSCAAAVAYADAPTPAYLNWSLQVAPGDAGYWFGGHMTPFTWFNKDVSITDTPTLSSEDTDTLIPASYFAYSVSGSAFTSITASPLHTFSAEGVYSLDATGSLETTSYEATTGPDFGIDKTRPTSTSNLVPVYDNAATITVTAADALSGPEYVLYSLDGASDYATPTATPGETTALVADIAVTTPGWHTLSWFSVDNAGNFEHWHVTSFLVNPTGYMPVLGKPKVSVHKRTGMLSGSVTPAATNKTLTFTFMRKSGKSWKAWRTAPITITKYASAYAVGLRFTRAGTYRVRAAEGAGVSAWSKEYKVK